MLDKKLDSTLNKLQPVKEKLIARSQNILEKGKEKSNTVSLVIIEHLESTLKNLAVTLKKEIKNMNNQDENLDEMSLKERAKRLANLVNQLSFLVTDEYFQWVKNTGVFKNLLVKIQMGE